MLTITRLYSLMPTSSSTPFAYTRNPYFFDLTKCPRLFIALFSDIPFVPITCCFYLYLLNIPLSHIGYVASGAKLFTHLCDINHTVYHYLYIFIVSYDVKSTTA